MAALPERDHPEKSGYQSPLYATMNKGAAPGKEQRCGRKSRSISGSPSDRSRSVAAVVTALNVAVVAVTAIAGKVMAVAGEVLMAEGSYR
ncbi:hypothetical protein KM043_014890 [Ampulex compressa]|nr:hypothetical protein KM043_014890 [Ampulex compressa]